MLFGDLQSIFQLGLATYLVSDWFELTSSARVWSAVERKLHNDFSSRESRIENLLGHRFLKDKFDINKRLKQEERIIEWAIHPLGADIEEDMDDWHQIGKVLALVLLLASSFFAATSIWLLAGFLLVGIGAIPLIAIKAGYWLRYDFLRF